MALTKKQKDFIQLVGRSPDVGDGWRMVSERLTKMALSSIGETPALYEIDYETGENGEMLKIRFSEEGKIVVKYL